MKKRIFIMIPSLLFYHAPLQAQQDNQGVKQTTVITNTSNPSESSKTTITTTSIPVEMGISEEDGHIITAVYNKFAKVSALFGTSLTVSCENGVVTISGTVISQSQADAAIEAAKSVPFVRSVRSNINVTTNPGFNKSATVPNY